MHFMIWTALLAAMCFGATADGAPIRVTSVSATYWTAVDEIEFLIRFDRPLGFPGDYLQFGAGRLPGVTPPIEAVFASNSPVSRDGTITLTRIRFTPTGGVESEDVIGLIDYQIDGNLFMTSIPFEWTGFTGTDFAFNAYVRGANTQPHEFYGLEGLGSVDERVTYVPEPSAATSAACGALVLLWICASRARKRQAMAR